MHSNDRTLRLIALFKFCKATLLVAAGLGAFELLQPSAAAQVQRWVAAFAGSAQRLGAQRFLAWIQGLSPGRLEAVGIAAFLYASLFLVEGVGLWLAKRWAEYLTVVATMLLVPFEIFELTRRVNVPRATTLMFNLVVVAYLVYRLRSSRSAAQSRSPSS